MSKEQEVEILEETPTTLTDNADTTTVKKRPGPINPRNSELREFHVIHFGSSITTQIPHNSHHFPAFLWARSISSKSANHVNFV